MKKVIALVVLLCGFMPVLWAADGCDQHLSREEFRAKQKAFIIEQAGLSKQEAAKFFPVYFELQDKKKKLNDESWDLMRKGKDDKTTESQYEEINEKVANNRIAADQLDKTYLSKFKKILSCTAGGNAFPPGNDKRHEPQGWRKRFEKEIMMKNRGSVSCKQTLCSGKIEAPFH